VTRCVAYFGGMVLVARTCGSAPENDFVPRHGLAFRQRTIEGLLMQYRVQESGRFGARNNAV